MITIRFVIEDESHAEIMGEYSTFQEALTELKRLSFIAWNEAPNKTPCASSQKCGRNYEIVEYDISSQAWREIKRVPMLEINAKGVFWK